MIISRQGVEAYLNRKLRDSARAKEFPEEVLDRKLAKLYPPFECVMPPRHHQKVAMLLGTRHPKYLFLLDCGLGKSAVVLNLFRRALVIHPEGGEPLRMLVLVPGRSNLPQWADQIKIHAPELTYQAIDANGQGERLLQIGGKADVIAITYAGLLSLTSDKKGSRTPKASNGFVEAKSGWKLDPQKLREIFGQFHFLCYDEADAGKNHRSLTFKACKFLAQRKETIYAYGLTGTPFGKSPHDLWGLFNIFDNGETLGETLGIFRAAFFNEVQNFWGGYEYNFKEGMKGELARMIRHNSIRYEESECNDLPEVVEIERPVIFPKETWVYYEKLVSELQEARGNFRLIENVFVRMRTLCSGYLTVKDPEGERHDIIFKENPKLDDLLQFLNEIPEDRKVVVFLEYIKTGEIVCNALTKAKIKHTRLYSGTKKSDNSVERFLHDKKMRVLVSSSAGARGLNLQAATYVYFFESPCSPTIRLQEQARVHRMGQTKRTFVIDSYVKGSIEKSILLALRHDHDLFVAIANGKFPKSLSKIKKKKDKK